MRFMTPANSKPTVKNDTNNSMKRFIPAILPLFNMWFSTLNGIKNLITHDFPYSGLCKILYDL